MSRERHDATAYVDPVTGNVNLILVQRDGDDVIVGTDFDCIARRVEYGARRVKNSAVSGSPGADPAPVTAALAVDEAEAIHRALEAVLTEVPA